MQYSQEHLKTMVYAEFGGQTECIMGNWKIENEWRIDGDWKWLSVIYLVVLLLLFFISVQDRITRHYLITPTKNTVCEQVLFFGLLTDQKLVPSHRKLYTMKQFIQSKEMCHEIYKTSIKQRKLPTNWVKRKTNLQNVKRKYKSPSKYRRRCGWANMKKIETDCNCGFWKLVSLTC